MSAHEDAEDHTASDAINIVRKELKKTTPFADLSIITQASVSAHMRRSLPTTLLYRSL